ncbi:uncharacterized protein LOC129962418 isoform X1 [Argiope bruennichi]|uniref:uncharacterized protein LOC129962418 isoform X1 n=2 Tax=Argiope bruennichi TaxID=94029 RepID=UPI0024946BBA|nr:uncharacterized protein LOC129962418 isoform X1 [Argiope bruennichi]
MHGSRFDLWYVYVNMQSPVAYLIGLLSVIHFTAALSDDAHTDSCVAKILSCDWYRQPFSLQKENEIRIFSKIEDLKKACKDQAAYIKCMGRAENFCEKTNLLPSAEEMIKNRRFSADICRTASPWQQLYLNEASCLNTYTNRDYPYCTNKIIGMGYLNPENIFERGCRYGRAIIDCSATRLQEKCGYYAGIILKKFLKFHSLSDYKCKDFKDVEDYSFASTPTEVISNTLESSDFDDKAIFEKESRENLNFGETKLDNLDNKSFTRVAVTKVNFDEFLTKVKDSFSGSLDFDANTTTESNMPEFPAVPKYHYIHKNRTTFVLYEDLEMGYAKYIGCGEADFFWIILSPLKNKYCTLMDLKSEYSEGLFKCTIHIDAACSPELDDEDRNKNAEVFHRRYVATVLTPPNNQLSEDMAVMNIHYLKIFPSHSMYAPEKKVNLWTTETNMGAIEQAEPVRRKGSLESEDDHSILYQHSNGSGQKRDAITSKHSHYSDEYEYYEEYKNRDYQPVEEEDKIYSPALFQNDMIYIEDNEGDLMSLHDPRSPIYSNSLYQPNSLFRPRVGEMPESTDLREFEETESTEQKKKLILTSLFKERVLKLKDEESFSKLKEDQQEYCSAEEPCPPNSEKLKFGIKPGMYLLAKNIKIFDPLKGMEVKAPPKSLSSIKLNEGTAVKSHLDSREMYNVRLSTKIQVPKYTELSHSKEIYKDYFTTYSPNLPEEEIYDNIDITDVPSYLDSSCGSTLTSEPNFDFETYRMESFDERSYEFTQSPYKYFRKSDTEVRSKPTIVTENLRARPSWERCLEKILGRVEKILRRVWKTLLKTVDTPFKRKFLVGILIKLFERNARGF